MQLQLNRVEVEEEAGWAALVDKTAMPKNSGHNNPANAWKHHLDSS